MSTLKYCEQITTMIADYVLDEAGFETDLRSRHALCVCLLQIGELSRGLSDAFKAETLGAIPWKEIRGTRNLIVHKYGNVNSEVISKTLIEDIPLLAEFCQGRLEEATGKLPSTDGDIA